MLCVGLGHKDDSEIAPVHQQRPVYLGRKRSQAAVTVQLWRGPQAVWKLKGEPFLSQGPMKGSQDTVMLGLKLESGGIHQVGEGWMIEEAL